MLLSSFPATLLQIIKVPTTPQGVQPENMPVLFKSLENEAPTTVPMDNTLADAVAVPNVGVNAFANIQPHLDKMVCLISQLFQQFFIYKKNVRSNFSTFVYGLVSKTSELNNISRYY